MSPAQGGTCFVFFFKLLLLLCRYSGGSRDASKGQTETRPTFVATPPSWVEQHPQRSASEAKEAAKMEVTQWQRGPERSLITGDTRTHTHAQACIIKAPLRNIPDDGWRAAVCFLCVVSVV